ncbi:hypothetical protein GGU10DRAFT_271348 [Lentinula aff. detonsa]|uniref:Protein-tyrosine-phosphatase n=1 Tax=Lentinula aff. detonsa TaxID=2804958 RepID=A0AA38NPE7_9AGAR|nr:hypothetical protein GGU10DRAFT_271348 [Lentinula aff. detonsa]
MNSCSASVIHTLTPSQFKDLHYQHILSHPPDSVLFPFLHGIEGDNDAQNHFFATQGQQVVYSRRDDDEQPIYPQVNRARVPRYRGMMWVICEDDLENPDKDLQILVHRPSNLSSYASSEHYDDSSDSYFDDDDELDDDFDDSSSDSFGEPVSPDSTTPYTKDPVVRPASSVEMDLDIQYNDASDDVDAPHHNSGAVEIIGIDTDEKHMHPVQHRSPQPLPTPIRTTDLPNSHHVRSPTTTTTNTTTSGFSSSPVTDSGTEPSTALTEPDFDDRQSSPLRIPGSYHHKHPSSRKTPPPPILTSTFRASDLLRPVRGSETSSDAKPLADGVRSAANSTNFDDGEWEFVPLHVPEGISLRNFGIQVPILASVSDIIIYSPNSTGAVKSDHALRLARRFKQALDKKRRERIGCEDDGQSTNSSDASDALDTPLRYNVFLLDANADEIRREMPHLIVKLYGDTVMTENDNALSFGLPASPSSRLKTPPNTVDFAQREKDEMRDLTRASEIVSMFPKGHHLNCLNPDPLHPPVHVQPSSHHIPTSTRDEIDLSNTKTFWDPHAGQIYLGNSNDVPLPVNGMGDCGELDPRWDGHDSVETDVYPPGNSPRHGYGYDICIECHELAPFPTLAHLKASEEKVNMLERKWKNQVELSKKVKGELHENYLLPPRPPPHPNAIIHLPMPSSPPVTSGTMGALMPVVRFLQKSSNSRLRSMTSPGQPINARQQSQNSSAHSRHSSLSYLSSSSHTSSFPWSRPLKILLYSADGYTESSVPALCLLMAMKGLSLPRAYLELQVAKRRSFFVYQADLGVLRKSVSFARSPFAASTNDGASATSSDIPTQHDLASRYVGTGGLKGSATLPMSSSAPSSSMTSLEGTGEISSTSVIAGRTRRPRASTSPWLPSLFGGDHQSWFNDPRFDGSFPSRVLPFLYLGNLAHASNVYMLQALGITHVVSVGECALVPPDSHNARGHSSFQSYNNSQGSGHFIPSKSSGHQGSLWIEERAGRIKVLDIQGVCDDGIDTLEPQLEPICDWIDQARQESGQVLVHCRVGVSRSATVTIAYVMKHLSLPLVDAYLIVRSRRLSVLIQPNLRLLYNLLGWEIKLAKDRAGNDDEKLSKELSCALSWPFLAKEVHALNEKYLR